VRRWPLFRRRSMDPNQSPTTRIGVTR
jgi:hypothetical protein